MAGDDVTEQVAHCCVKIMEVMNEEKASKYVALHSIGAVLCQILAQIDSEEHAKIALTEMLDVVMQTMGTVKQARDNGVMSGAMH